MKSRNMAEIHPALQKMITKSCSEFIKNCSNPLKCRQLMEMEINESIKFSSRQLKQTKMTTKCVTKNSTIITNTNVITRYISSTLTSNSTSNIEKGKQSEPEGAERKNSSSKVTFGQLLRQHTQQLHKKQEQFLSEIMKHIIQNIKINLQRIFSKNISNKTRNKDKLIQVIDILEDQFFQVNEQLAQVLKYTKHRQLKKVIDFNLHIDKLSAKQFVELVFTNLPQLKDYFQKFQIQTLNNTQLRDLKQCELVQYLLDVNQLIQKRENDKKLKKKNKKKLNNAKNDNKQISRNFIEPQSIANQSTSQNQQKQQQINANSTNRNVAVSQSAIISYLKNMEVNQHRTACNTSDAWLKKLTSKYRNI